MSIWKPLAVAYLLLLLSVSANGQTTTADEKCKNDPHSVFCLCRDGAEKPDASVFEDLSTAALEVRNQFCSGLLSQDVVGAHVLDFVSDNDAWEAKLGGFDGEVSAAIIEASMEEGGPVGVTDPFVTDDDAVMIRVHNSTFAVKDQAACAAAIVSEDSEIVRCEKAVASFVDNYAYAQKTYAAYDEYAFARNIGNLRTDWDNYFEQSRGQTSLELFINSYLHRRDETTKFSGPPEKQWIFLHPEIVIENVSAAADGEQLEEALALELIGVNYWRQDRWYVPSGGSIVMLYSDKASTDDVGYGFQLHFKSVYSIGYSNRGGDNGVFISVDLVKLFRDKQTELGAYLE